MTATLDAVLESVNDLESNSAEQFEALARAIFAGEKPGAARVLDILRAAEKSKDDLSRLVRLLESRAQFRANIDELAKILERDAELRRLVEVENAKLEEHVVAHQAATRPLQTELAQNRDRKPDLSGMEQKLFQTCQDKSLKSRLSLNQHYQQRNLERQSKAADSLHRAESQVGGHDYQHFPAERQRIDAWLVRAKAEHTAALQEAGELQEQGKQIERAMRDW